MPYKSLEQRKMHQKAYSLANKQKISLINKVYRQTHEKEIKAYQKKWRLEHKEKIKNYRDNYGKDYYLENKARIDEKHRAYYQNNKEKRTKKIKEWGSKNKPKLVEYTMKWRRNNKDRIKEWENQNKDLIKASLRKYRRSSKGKLNLLKRKTLERKAEFIGGITLEEVKQILGTKVCFYCRKEEEKLSFDHVKALSKGGLNNKENLVMACISCNSSKRDREVVEWCKEKGFKEALEVLQ